MCLVIRDKNNHESKIAKEDIVCYKFMRKGLRTFLLFGSRSYISPMYPKNWKLNALQTSRLSSSRVEDMLWGDDDSDIVYIEDGLHSFKEIEDVEDYISNMKVNQRNKYTICRAIIPEGSEYYEGELRIDGKNCVQYASNQLILTDAGVDNV